MLSFLGNRYVEVAPVDVIWSNLGMNPYEQKVDLALSLPSRFDASIDRIFSCDL
jgi:hypothetical protein